MIPQRGWYRADQRKNGAKCREIDDNVESEVSCESQVRASKVVVLWSMGPFRDLKDV